MKNYLTLLKQLLAYKTIIHHGGTFYAIKLQSRRSIESEHKTEIGRKKIKALIKRYETQNNFFIDQNQLFAEIKEIEELLLDNLTYESTQEVKRILNKECGINELRK